MFAIKLPFWGTETIEDVYLHNNGCTNQLLLRTNQSLVIMKNPIYVTSLDLSSEAEKPLCHYKFTLRMVLHFHFGHFTLFIMTECNISRAILGLRHL